MDGRKVTRTPPMTMRRCEMEMLIVWMLGVVSGAVVMAFFMWKEV